MQKFQNKTDPRLVSLLQSGGVAVLRTDTLYGFVARADDAAAVQRIYDIKGRDYDKPFIVLISSADMLYDDPISRIQEKIAALWPGPVSIVLPSPSSPDWLRRGGQTLAYRNPADEALCRLIEQTGPLVAPSANPQGEPTALTIDQAVEYFDDRVDAYVDSGQVDPSTPPSKLFVINEQGDMERLR